MQIRKAVLLSFLSVVFVYGANASQMKYSNSEIYTKMCSKCHGANGEGNPKKKGPVLNDMTIYEIESELFAIQNSEMDQSSGGDHDVMSHNQEKIEQKGMDYEPKSMAKFIYHAFNPEAKYEKSEVKKDRPYTIAEIYTKMCSKCHGVNGEGNPKKKGPALNDMTAHEIESELFAIQNAEMDQSSGSDHDVMSHNQEKIEEKGMDYKPKDMAEYIEKNFYKK